MLSLEDKEKQWESFRDGAQFGKHTWITLQLFDINTHDIIVTVLANKVLDKKFCYFGYIGIISYLSACNQTPNF